MYAGGLVLLGIIYRDCRGGESTLESTLTTCIVSREPFESCLYFDKPVSEHSALSRSFDRHHPKIQVTTWATPQHTNLGEIKYFYQSPRC